MNVVPQLGNPDDRLGVLMHWDEWFLRNGDEPHPDQLAMFDVREDDGGAE